MIRLVLIAVIVLGCMAGAAAEVEPDSAAIEAYNAYVEAYEAGDRQEAEKHLKAASAAQPDWADPYVHLGRLYIEQERFSTACATLAQAAEMMEDDAEVAFYWGYALYRDGQYGDAAVQLEKSLALEEKKEEATEVLAQANLELGNQLKTQKKMGDAARAYRAAIKYDPSLFAAQYNLGNLYYEQQDYADAEEALSKAVKLDPKHYKAHFNLAIALHAQGKLEEALAEYQAVVKTGKGKKGASSTVSTAEQTIKGIQEQLSSN